MRVISYKPLFDLLNKKQLKLKHLKAACGLSFGTLARLGKGQAISLTNISQICQFLNCKIEEVVEFIEVEDSKEK